MTRKILFLTGTRADFGKMKSLIAAAGKDPAYEVHVLVTGMHLLDRYGSTEDEVRKCGFENIHSFPNQNLGDDMDTILAKTVLGVGACLRAFKPDLLVVHGDRVEALAGAISGALNNVLVAHIEGGEVSGTIDESIRHSVSKLAHLHFVANEDARRRLLQMGEAGESIHVIGSPDIDLMVSPHLPGPEVVRRHYDIRFSTYGILIYHPVTTEVALLGTAVRSVLEAAEESGSNFIAIYPNNDPGSDVILDAFRRYESHPRFRVLPSVRFESFLVLLRDSNFILGNSSAGIREAIFYGVPTINVGTRQAGRFEYPSIRNVPETKEGILKAIREIGTGGHPPSTHFGDGRSTQRFMGILRGPALWSTRIQKRFLDTD